MGTVLDKLATMKPTARPEFEAAFAACGDRPVCIAIVPPAIFARTAQEVLRNPLVGGNQPLGAVLARGVQWLAVGADANLETFSAQLTIQSADAEAAESLFSAIKQGVALLAKNWDSTGAGATAVLNAAAMFSLLPEPKGNQLLLSIDGARAKVFRTLADSVFAAATAAQFQRASLDNLKQIGLAILNYEDKQKELPNHAIRDKDGKPLLSWRVAVLPDVDEYGLGLYKQFHLDEPWDSEHNRKLIEKMPEAFKSPATAHFCIPAGRGIWPWWENTRPFRRRALLN